MERIKYKACSLLQKQALDRLKSFVIQQNVNMLTNT